jgi:menaquinone-dependent protoporphyrinogen oxidase
MKGMTHIAIVYASRYGATKGIAERLEEFAQKAGLQADLLEAKAAAKADLTEYDGIIVGAGIQIGKVPGSLKKFLKKRKATLLLFKDRLAVFLCCGAAGEASGVEEAQTKYLQPLLTEFNLTPGTTDIFGGVYDLRANSAFGSIKSAIIRKMVEEQSPDKYDLNGLNDMRDWEAIEAWFQGYLTQFNE